MQKKASLYILTGISIAAYFYLGYFSAREEFEIIISIYTLTFISFLLLYQKLKQDFNFKLGLRVAMLFRLVFLVSIPFLSNDFYRFIWDGRMIQMGYNPFLILPSEFALTDSFQLLGQDAGELLAGQGSLSPNNYTCYPPLNQFMFYVSVLFFPQNILGSIIVMRLMIVAADFGTIWYGRKILNRLGLAESNILLYALNPFIIIEMSGNLHFEAITVFFLVLAIWFLLKEENLKSAVWLAMSVSVKLIPLIFLPLYLKKLGQLNSLKYYFGVGLISVLLFIPFLSADLIQNFMSSIDLYFRKFEFNASIYYLLREAGYYFKGWNIIQDVGPLLGITVFLIVITMAIVRKNQEPKHLMVSMLFAVSVYYFLATTVHPWYIVIPLIISVFTNYRFVIAWSFVIMLSYAAYSHPEFKENLWLVGVEYFVVFSFLSWEILQNRNLKRI
jgi:hypothetical protein